MRRLTLAELEMVCGGGVGQDSADYNGPDGGQDTTQYGYGPDTMDFRAAASAQAFFSWADAHANAQNDMATLMAGAADQSSAAQRVGEYIDQNGGSSFGLSGGQVGDIIVTASHNSYYGSLPTIDMYSIWYNNYQGGNPVGESSGEPTAPFINAAAGHMAFGTARHLTSGEITALSGYTSLTPAELNAVMLFSGGAMSGAAATTWSGTSIDFDTTFALNDFSKDPATMGLLIHELYHVNQWDNYPGATAGFIASEAAGLYRDVYSYTASDLTGPWTSLNYETQAQIAEDLYRVEHALPPEGAAGFAPDPVTMRLDAF